MKKLLYILAVSLILSANCAAAQEEFHPRARQGATVIQGNARFTVLTPELIRMEWSEDGLFEDRATLGIVNRDLEVPEYKVRRSGRNLTITTSSLTLTYKGGRFSKENLSISFRMKGPDGKKTLRKTWRPGDDDRGNLLGTCRTLDRFDGTRVFEHGGITYDPYDKGVLSRDGWAVIDESARHILAPVDSDWKYWVEERPEGDRLDWYMFAYGHDYTRALGDFIKVAGRIPLPPKYALGYWWCRYWLYSDAEIIDLARHFESYDIPADVFIIDMDWHDTWGRKVRNNPRDEAGQSIGWTGYTWKRELFPSPENLLHELHSFHMKTSLNLHPASGIQVFEEPYERFVKDYLSRTDDYDGPKGYVKADNTPAYVPFRMDQQAWADAYFNSVIRPLEKQGVDFWWLDWQQFRQSKYVSGLSNTFWLNYTFWNDMARRSADLGKDAPRPMIYHRWGGIGSHRYQVGFSGDTYATWKVLAYLPYFTATASNIGYAWWGHDIGGHQQPKGVHHTDPELYTRWLQEAVFTPIFKTHSSKDFSMEKRFWAFPEQFDAMRDAIRLRYDLSPYIYTAARKSYDTGIGMCRPLYYEWPEEDRAYTRTEEFMFGDDILATTVCQPADKVTGLAKRSMWFPEAEGWFEVSTGTFYKGGTEAELQFTLNENPWFVRAGAVIPLAGTKIRSLQENNNEIRFMVVPGADRGSAVLYEDDGVSQAYASDFATTEVRHESIPDGIRVIISARKGNYKGMPATRRVSVILPGVNAPGRVTVNGKDVPYDRFAALRQDEKAVWGYAGDELTATIYLPEQNASENTVIECECKAGFINGEKGLMKRLRSLMPEIKAQFATSIDRQMQLTTVLLQALGTPSFINENPTGAAGYLESMGKAKLREHITGLALSEDFKRKLVSQLCPE